MFVNTVPILHFQWDAVFAHCDDKIHLWLNAALWKPGEIQSRDGAEKISNNALRNMPCQITGALQSLSGMR